MNTDTTPSTPAAPGRPGLSFEAYEQAYLALTGDDGIPPSQRQLRKYLGTGSNTTLAGYRRRIAEERVVDEKPLEPGTVDAELLATVQRLAHQIHIDEAQMAEDRVDELQKEADNRVRIAEATMEKRLQDTNLLEHRATRAEAELAEERARLTDKEAELIALVDAHQSLKEDQAAAMQSLTDANRQIATLIRELSQREQSLEHAREDEKSVIKEAAEAATAQQTALASVQQALAETQTTLAKLAEKNTSLNERISERNQLIEMQNSQQRDLQVRLDKSIEAQEAVLVQLDELKHERETLVGQCRELSIALDSEKRLSKATTDSLESTVNDKATQIEHLQKTVSELTSATRKR